MIVCVAVVGHQNNPLYIQSFTDADDALKLHHIVHCSLDVVDERVNNPKKPEPTLNETFLGLLYPTENYKVYGYLTNTNVKFILVTTDLDVKDADVRNVCWSGSPNTGCILLPPPFATLLRFGVRQFSTYEGHSDAQINRIFGECGSGMQCVCIGSLRLLGSYMGQSLYTWDWSSVLAPGEPVPPQVKRQTVEFFRRFHAAYVDAVSNPFHVPGKKITSKTFAETVSTIVKSFGLSSAG
ncbi:hypothetical protein TIFTF001_007444 [Ficus carica]|uniref:Trafficking protein particle complex subunit 2-like protein n=1 Tax=Ficus carica TaxID=3494 RepID=A0AA88A6L7_FICCA|nr:hypothetical protein TIFTF001_007444 [Ficus carica]